ncbi:adenine-specific methyltransferase EcoRI family protein [uncultured Porphyromonas sp.]|jgi:modification methylase ecoRI|uniref:adenine-specific methyltransferase EcoRI family protein n=1 Tax=uncultured Porphyromonas sp. TaxID=159274 RepID=UPI002629997E|nr:adenine-specific methyltransferase EcoRI family protein [uncultured Porphyromonas sp.]
MANKQLTGAKKAKKDEFYTQLADIEAELKHYREHFKDKTVLCNCDDPRMSKFFYYFVLNFHLLGLKKLITTCYKNQNPSLFSESTSEQAVYLVYEGEDIGIPPNPSIAGLVRPLLGDGDFRSAECIAFLEEADIVVTNPPFSLFREYVAQLIKYDKKFIIIGNINAVTYKEIFPLIQRDQVWLGPSIHSGDREFEIPSSYPLEAAGSRTDNEGRRYIRVKGVRWFTNLDFPQRHEELTLYKKYSPEEYPHYDNYDAINVDKVADIPYDYDGVMGVPITYLDKHNPDQFEILGITESNGRGFSTGLWDEASKKAHPYVKGEKKYARIFIRTHK